MGKAAVHAPALVVLSHTPAGAKETVAWVGKGIVYDTGGLSIKVTLTEICSVHVRHPSSPSVDVIHG